MPSRHKMNDAMARDFEVKKSSTFSELLEAVSQECKQNKQKHRVKKKRINLLMKKVMRKKSLSSLPQK